MEANGKLAGLIAQLEQKNQIVTQLTEDIKNLLKKIDGYGNAN